jgi:serine/threonine-protein kinase RsbT
MPASRSEELPIRSSADVVKVRQVVRTWAAELGFSLVDQTKLVTGASELARNALDHGRGGAVRLQMLDDGVRRGLGMLFEDQGPGIADIHLALTDGYTTGNGLGLGLSGTRRLMTEFRVDSAPGQGTRIYCARWR